MPVSMSENNLTGQWGTSFFDKVSIPPREDEANSINV